MRIAWPSWLKLQNNLDLLLLPQTVGLCYPSSNYSMLRYQLCLRGILLLFGSCLCVCCLLGVFMASGGHSMVFQSCWGLPLHRYLLWLTGQPYIVPYTLLALHLVWSSHLQQQQSYSLFVCLILKLLMCIFLMSGIVVFQTLISILVVLSIPILLPMLPLF